MPDSLTLDSLSLEESQSLDSDSHLAATYDILFAYLYELRFQHFAADFSDESVKNICLLSSCLSWHIDSNQWSDPKQRARAFMIASYRRVLCYGADRNLQLCQRVHSDLVSLGRAEVNTCL